MRSLVVVLAVLPVFAFSHGGRLDKHGGHGDRKVGTYHCHKEPCISQSATADMAISKAVEGKRAFSYVYRRQEWKHWSDFDKDCMNTRHEILKAQAEGPVTLSPDGCFVSTGVWNDPFSGKRITRASDLDVDHIIPLKWASDHGGGGWSAQMKEQFANDPVNLLAVDDGLNQAKGAKGPDEWMPPNHRFRCEYLSMWNRVLKKYTALVMPASMKRVFDRGMKACGARR